MDLIELHRLVIQNRFPNHRIEDMKLRREPAPIYTMGTPPTELDRKRRRRIELFLTGVSQDESVFIKNLVIGERLDSVFRGFEIDGQIIHKDYEISGEVYTVDYICGNSYAIELIDAKEAWRKAYGLNRTTQ